MAQGLNRVLFAIALLLAIAAIGLSAYVAFHPFIPEDAGIERDIQATQWGPVALTFPIFTWIGDAKGFALEVIMLVGILIFNRRAWLFAATAALTVAWYQVGINLIHRPRPTTAQVLQVTEHPGASSYPSGHTIFIVTVMVVLMMAFGYRFLPRWSYPIGWTIVGLVVVANAIARVYTGAHWPTDVVGAILIAAAWLTFLLSLRWISQRVLPTDR